IRDGHVTGVQTCALPILAERRALARDRVARLGDARVVFPDGVVGAGRAFFERAVGQGHEGVVAKHLAGRYLPGRRSACWKKVKPDRKSTRLNSSHVAISY